MITTKKSTSNKKETFTATGNYLGWKLPKNEISENNHRVYGFKITAKEMIALSTLFDDMVADKNLPPELSNFSVKLDEIYQTAMLGDFDMDDFFELSMDKKYTE